MKHRKTILSIVGGVVLGIVALSLIWDPLDRWWTVRTAVDQITMGTNLSANHERLKAVDDRQYVLDKITAALDRNTSVASKMRLLKTLGVFRQHRAVQRSFASGNQSTRRAYLALYPFDKRIARKEKADVILAWITDDQADMRDRAMNTAGNLGLKEAAPAMLAILDQPPKPGANLVGNAIDSLGRLQPEGLADKLIGVAADKRRDAELRARTLKAAANLPDAPLDRVRELAIALVKDHSSKNARMIAVGVLDRPKLANSATIAALTEVLLAEDDPHPHAQQSCFRALGKTAPLEDFSKLLLDKRVYTHEDFALRIFSTAALAVLRPKQRLTLEILCEHLVDKDPQDKRRKLRWEAYLSLFTLTGMAPGIEQKELFVLPPKEYPDKERARLHLFNTEAFRAGISTQQVDAVKAIVKDDDKMARIRQIYLNNIDMVLENWRKQDEARKKAEEKAKNPDGAKDGDTPDKNGELEETGPKPPKKSDG